MVHLGVNIDHVATLRQARRSDEPDPVWAAAAAQLAGAQCITVHLREDRRHIQDHDLARLTGVCRVKLNLEMAATEAMVAIALRFKPQMVTLVPEGRLEVTTEGGLDVAGQVARLTGVVGTLKAAGISSSAFIDAVPEQIHASAQAGFEWCEVHTGPYAQAFSLARDVSKEPALHEELRKLSDAGALIQQLGMKFNAGHALGYDNVQPVAALAGVRELHIGHSIVSRSVFTGFERAVSDMLKLIEGSTKR